MCGWRPASSVLCEPLRDGSPEERATGLTELRVGFEGSSTPAARPPAPPQALSRRNSESPCINTLESGSFRRKPESRVFGENRDSSLRSPGCRIRSGMTGKKQVESIE